MFGFFKKADPRKKLEKQYNKMLEDARDLQRGGDIKGYAKMMAEAEEIAKKIQDLNKKA